MKKTSQINRNIRFSIKNIRCFRKNQTLNIRPLTFLVGENSTGKTAILSSFNELCQLMDIRMPWYASVNFNRPPYNMGSFEDIVSKSGNTVKIGEFQFGFHSESPKVEGMVCFKGSKKRSEPIIKKICINYEEHDFNFDYSNKKISYKNQTGNDKMSWPFPDKLKEREEEESFIPFDVLLYFMTKEIASKNKKQLHKNILKLIKNMRQYLRQNFQTTLNLAPVRSKPQRTYDPIREAPDPEGSETPMYLNRISSTKSNEWKQLYRNLVQFGKISGLFTDIKVQKPGKSMGEPFQLHFKVNGAVSNIMDIGYGVSQILPLLMRMFLSNKIRFLLQQPEVHLHPKAQAELSSLLIKNIKINKNFFLIETHSDYMVDRVRIEIQKGNITPDQVSLIYLESTRKEVKTHNISFDKQGNVLGAPTGYRNFFTTEMNRVLGFEDK